MTPMTPPERPAADYQSRLAWVYSLYAGIFAFLFSLLIFSPVSGPGFAVMASVSALICARIAGWIADYFGRSTYGLVTCAITAILFSMVPILYIISYSGVEYLNPATQTVQEMGSFAVLMGIYFVVGAIYAVPTALVATFVFQLTLLIARKLQWLAFEQQWI